MSSRPYVGINQIRLSVEDHTFLSACITSSRLFNCRLYLTRFRNKLQVTLKSGADKMPSARTVWMLQERPARAKGRKKCNVCTDGMARSSLYRYKGEDSISMLHYTLFGCSKGRNAVAYFDAIISPGIDEEKTNNRSSWERRRGKTAGAQVGAVVHRFVAMGRRKPRPKIDESGCGRRRRMAIVMPAGANFASLK